MSNGGGAAVNGGVDFQQRIAALVMLQILAGINDYQALNLGNNVDVEILGFETDDAIDDLVLGTSQGNVFIQAKRALSLSANRESDFSSVIQQFIRQFVKEGHSDDIYLLATTPDSSRKITQELKRITNSRRLNESYADQNPTTKSEIETFARTKELAEAHYFELTGKPLPPELFEKLLRKIRIATVAIEAGSHYEAAVLTLLYGRTDVQPSLLWDALIAFAVSLSKDRLSIDRAGLNEKMGRYFKRDGATPAVEDEPAFLPVELAGPTCSGRDLILVESFVEGADFLIMELFRFEDDGSRRLCYENGKVELKNGKKLKVFHRAATYAGIQRCLTESSSLEKDARVVILAANAADDVEERPFVKAHAAHCRTLLVASSKELQCIRCGSPVSETLTPSIEIDEVGAEHQVGLCHKQCVQPTDRVLGLLSSALFEENNLLRNFDYRQWFRLRPRGQGVFGGIQTMPGIKRMLWNPAFKHSGQGQWCVRIDLEDGSARYAHERGHVVRMGRKDAEGRAERMNQDFASHRKRKDPWCFTSKTSAFSTVSTVMKHASHEGFIECVEAVVVRYSTSIGTSYGEIGSYYAPLMALIDEDSGEFLDVLGATVLLTDPLDTSKYLDSWRHAGVILPPFSTQIIATDLEFDIFMRQLSEHGASAVVDPLLTPTSDLAAGVVMDCFQNYVGSEGASND